MLDVILHALQAIVTLLSMIAVGYWACKQGWCNESGRGLIAKLVNFSIPFMLFYTVTAKFDHAQLLRTMSLAGLPFIILAINYAVSRLLVRFGVVPADKGGTFIATFNGNTCMFVGVPVISAMFGDKGLLYLLVYFLANVTFVWSLGLYHVKLDGIAKTGGEQPKFLTAKTFKMLFLSKPILGFFAAVAVLLLSIPVPSVITSITRMFQHLVSPLALIFVGTTIFFVGFEKLKHLKPEHWLVLFSCFVLRPFITWCITSLFGADAYAQQVLIISSAMPVSSVIATQARVNGGATEFASEIIGVSTVALGAALPILLLVVSSIH